MRLSDNEHYLFLRLYSIDLDTARHSLAVLDRVSDEDVRLPLLRDIVVTYARPFSVNRGKTHKRHAVTDALPRVVPDKHLALHATLMRYRNELFAHTDIEAYNPTPTRWEQYGNVTYPMTFWALDYANLNSHLPELDELVRAVESAVHDEISRIEASSDGASA